MRIFGIILVIVIVLVLIYSGVRWVANEVGLSGFLSGQRRSSEPEESAPVAKPSASVSRDDEGRVKVDFEKPSGLQEDIPTGFAAADLSPDFGRVEIASVRRPSSWGDGGGFTLRSVSELKDYLDITGWRIKSNNGEITVKGGASSVPPVNLQRIVLRPRTSAIFYADQQSFVKNVELNKCTGYLNNTYTLDPKLPKNCPRPDRGETIAFSGACQSFVRSLGSCEQPTSSELNRFTGSNNIPCHEFLEDLNYANCVGKYSSDPNFYSYGWRVWTSDEVHFDSQHDWLLLFDENSLLVDEYIY